MVEKIVDVPEGAEEFLFEAYKNEMLVGKTQEGYVSSLPDAPTVAENATLEKRVIELPADVIEGIKSAKQTFNLITGFIEEVEEIGLDLKLPALSTEGRENMLADWYLGHVEFVPKKEPQFYVEVDRGNDFRYVSFTTNDMVYPVLFTYNKRLMGETEADELVAGLTALNARKVKVEE